MFQIKSDNIKRMIAITGNVSVDLYCSIKKRYQSKVGWVTTYDIITSLTFSCKARISMPEIKIPLKMQYWSIFCYIQSFSLFSNSNYGSGQLRCHTSIFRQRKITVFPHYSRCRCLTVFFGCKYWIQVENRLNLFCKFEN